MNQKGISLFHLNSRIKGILSDSFETDVWVVAEISEMRYNQNGHCYLELVEKDKNTDQIIAKTRATIWSYTFRMLKPYFETSTGQRFSAGLKILFKASVEFQEVYGYSLDIHDIDPGYTIGDIARKRKEVLSRLEKEGVLEMNKELDFPEVPKCIAVVSSPTAAGYEDFVDQLENNPNGYQFHYKLFPAIMQGKQAEDSIISALERINEHEGLFDVVAIIRGGGSQADLNCFDSYWLAYNVAQFPLPVISGIGHERDETIVDIVANTRVKTPTAAAEFLIDRFDECSEYLEGLREQFAAEINEILTDSSEKINFLAYQFSPLVKQILERRYNQLNFANKELALSCKNLSNRLHSSLLNLQSNIQFSLEKRTGSEKTGLELLRNRITIEVQNFLKNQNHEVSLFEQSAKYLDPKNVLDKGYTLTLRNGKIIKDIHLLSLKDQIETHFRNGVVKSEVKKINPKK